MNVNIKNLTKSYQSGGFFKIFAKNSNNKFNDSCLIEVQDIVIECFPDYIYLNETTICNLFLYANRNLFNLTIGFNDISVSSLNYSLLINSTFFNRTFSNFSNFGNYSINVYEPNLNLKANKTIVVAGSNLFLIL